MVLITIRWVIFGLVFNNSGIGYYTEEDDTDKPIQWYGWAPVGGGTSRYTKVLEEGYPVEVYTGGGDNKVLEYSTGRITSNGVLQTGAGNFYRGSSADHITYEKKQVFHETPLILQWGSTEGTAKYPAVEVLFNIAYTTSVYFIWSSCTEVPDSSFTGTGSGSSRGFTALIGGVGTVTLTGFHNGPYYDKNWISIGV